MIVYDIETLKLADEVGGWGKKKDMGISMIGAYDYKDDEWLVYFKDNMETFFDKLSTRNTLITFNGVKFDNEVIIGTYPLSAEILDPFKKTHFDILQKVRDNHPTPLKRETATLGAIAEATVGIKKIGDGALAPELFKEGKIGELINYCLHDVRMTKSIMDFIIKNGHVKLGNGEIVEVSPPMDSSITKDDIDLKIEW